MQLGANEGVPCSAEHSPPLQVSAPAAGTPQLEWYATRQLLREIVRMCICSAVEGGPCRQHLAIYCTHAPLWQRPSPPAQAVTLHTSQGDLKLELYCEEAPKTCENFLALCASSYYDATIFHRHIPGFMLQGGDPTGSGQGGRSIYDTPSGKFADEIVSGLSHDRAGIVSMANSGPNTNGAWVEACRFSAFLCDMHS